MENAMVDNIFVVGMHHWGQSHLQIGDAYEVKFVPNNVNDPNEVALFDGNRCVAYLFREHAASMTYLLKRE